MKTSTKFIMAGAHGRVATIKHEYDPAQTIAMVVPDDISDYIVIGALANLINGGQDPGNQSGAYLSMGSDTGQSFFRRVWLALLIAFVLMLAWYGIKALLEETSFHSKFHVGQRLVAISTLMVFTLVACNTDTGNRSSHSSGSNSSSTTGHPSIEGGSFKDDRQEGQTARVSGGTTLDPDNPNTPSGVSSGLDNGIFYYHTDHLGSSSVVTDHSGAVVTRIAYTPFGKIDQDRSTGNDKVTHKYTGQELDGESELYYYNARYYDPDLGRFLTADTIIPDPNNLQAFNRYTYVLNNPIKYIDPTGHAPTGAGDDGGADSENGGSCGCSGSSDDGENDDPSIGLVGAAGIAAMADGPVPGIGDLIGLGLLGVVGIIEIYNIVQSKGGKQNQKDTGLADYTDDEISENARDPELSGKERRRFQKEEKARGIRHRGKGSGSDDNKESDNKRSMLTTKKDPVSKKQWKHWKKTKKYKNWKKWKKWKKKKLKKK